MHKNTHFILRSCGSANLEMCNLTLVEFGHGAQNYTFMGTDRVHKKLKLLRYFAILPHRFQQKSACQIDYSKLLKNKTICFVLVEVFG